MGFVCALHFISRYKIFKQYAFASVACQIHFSFPMNDSYANYRIKTIYLVYLGERFVRWLTL